MPRRPAHWASGLNKICLSGVPAWNGEMWSTGSVSYPSPTRRCGCITSNGVKGYGNLLADDCAAVVSIFRFVTTPIHPPHGRYTNKFEGSATTSHPSHPRSRPAVKPPLKGTRHEEGQVQPLDLDGFFSAFSDEFRGSEVEIRERLKAYVPHLRRLKPARQGRAIVDVGCGRGELLRLLRDSGVRVIGVDTNVEAVRRAVKSGVEAVVSDGLTYLSAQPDGSLAAVARSPHALLGAHHSRGATSPFRRVFPCACPGRCRDLRDPQSTSGTRRFLHVLD